MSTSVIDRVRQPEYTGENRCIPCTVTNVAIAVVLSAAVGYAWVVAVGAFWWAVGGGLFVLSLASIWLRGYLVPGTPELTKRYFPDWLLAKFDKGPQAAGGMAAGAASGADGNGEADGQFEDVDPETLLVTAGVVEPCEDVEDLCLVEDFAAAWTERMADIDEGDAERQELADQLGLDAESLTFRDYGGAFVAYHDDTRRVGQWESRAAFVADLAAARELPEWMDDWEALPVVARGQVLGGLRIFIEECPDCGGPVVPGMETVESCCRSQEVVAASCQDCGARLLEVPYDEEAMGAA